jgi:YceI-like domain
MPKSVLICLLFLLIIVIEPFKLSAQANIVTAKDGKVTFSSDAPLELINATSDKLKGAIDKSQNTFAFAISINSFVGFNGGLQKDHFHENYMETEKLPGATFTGKFIEPLDFNINGTYYVRAKGMFSLHGVQKERIIKGTVIINNGNISIDTMFIVKLEDHDIKVPKIVYEKIAEEIKVVISISFKR